MVEEWRVVKLIAPSATTELKRKRTASAGSPCPPTVEPVVERDLHYLVGWPRRQGSVIANIQISQDRRLSKPKRAVMIDSDRL